MSRDVQAISTPFPDVQRAHGSRLRSACGKAAVPREVALHVRQGRERCSAVVSFLSGAWRAGLGALLARACGAQLAAGQHRRCIQRHVVGDRFAAHPADQRVPSVTITGRCTGECFRRSAPFHCCECKKRSKPGFRALLVCGNSPLIRLCRPMRPQARLRTC